MKDKITYFVLGVLMASNILFGVLLYREAQKSTKANETIKFERKKNLINETEKITIPIPDLDSAIRVLGW